MITSAEHAKEYRKQRYYLANLKKEIPIFHNYCLAEGYMQALKGPEVKELLESMEKIERYAFKASGDEFLMWAQAALENFRTAVGENK